MRFLLNINSRTIHRADSTDKRCKLGQMQECNKMLFDTFAEAKEYLPTGKKVSAPCSFCLGPNFQEELGKE